MNQTLKKYLISSLITFLAGFAVVILAEIDSLTLESLKDGSIAGLIFAGLRAGIKAVIELFLATWGSK